MPEWIATLLGGLANVAGTIAGRVLIACGISVATYQGLDTSLTFLKTQALSYITGLPPDVLAMISALGIGEALSIIISAIVVRMTLNGITGGALTDWVKK